MAATSVPSLDPLPQGPGKRAYVRDMFGRIARHYDLLNRLMTLGMDWRWRKLAVRLVQPTSDGVGLDVGAGTGDLSFLLARAMPQGIVIGIDLTPEMLAVARDRAAREDPDRRIVFVQGDALALPFADDTFDALVTGFIMRNVLDMKQAFTEMHRVAKPGARVACIEVSHPDNRAVAAIHRFIFHRITPIVGRLISGDRKAYSYLPASAFAFPTRDRLADVMRAAGWEIETVKPLMLGVAALHVGVKQTSDLRPQTADRRPETEAPGASFRIRADP
jgi:demethylmenaquinone methyltransferase/2-methoxy-6-polyprenyl-1,4-benzoquinol methylase